MFSKRTRLSVWAIAVALSVLLTACGGSSDPESVSFAISVAGGAVMGGAATHTVKQGDTVRLSFTSDVAGQVHLHGYDHVVDVKVRESADMTFVANATGLFVIEMHQGAVSDHDHEDGAAAACNVDVTGVEVHAMAMPASEAGHYTVSVEMENFELSSVADNHWHLAVDGNVVGMYADPSVDVMVGDGSHELTVSLSDANHCVLPVEDTVMVGEGDGHDEMAMEDIEHEHPTEEVTIVLGSLEVRPR